MRWLSFYFLCCLGRRGFSSHHLQVHVRHRPCSNTDHAWTVNFLLDVCCVFWYPASSHWRITLAAAAAAAAEVYQPQTPRAPYLSWRLFADGESYVISIRDYDATVNDFTVKHYKIRKLDDGGCYISSKRTFPHIFALVSHYKGVHLAPAELRHSVHSLWAGALAWCTDAIPGVSASGQIIITIGHYVSVPLRCYLLVTHLMVAQVIFLHFLRSWLESMPIALRALCSL